jgi:hypothetical protein
MIRYCWWVALSQYWKMRLVISKWRLARTELRVDRMLKERCIRDQN